MRQFRKEGCLDRSEYLCRTREFSKKGSDLPQSNLNEKAVKMIRDAGETRKQMRQTISEKYSNAALAKKWQVSTQCIEKVLSFQTWAHVK